MAAGLPVVCSKIRGNVDLIENGKGGNLYDCHDVDGFAEGIKFFLENYTQANNNMERIKFADTSFVKEIMIVVYSDMISSVLI